MGSPTSGADLCVPFTLFVSTAVFSKGVSVVLASGPLVPRVLYLAQHICLSSSTTNRSPLSSQTVLGPGAGKEPALPGARHRVGRCGRWGGAETEGRGRPPSEPAGPPSFAPNLDTAGNDVWASLASEVKIIP